MIKTILSALAFVVAASFASAVSAQSEFPTPTAGKTVVGTVSMCLNGSGNAVPSSSGTCAAGAAVTTIPSASSATNSSSTITTGGTFQTIAAASTSRKSLEFVNTCNVSGNCTATTNYCYLFVAASGTPTTANSIPLAPGQSYLRSSGAIPSDAIQATCAGTADKFYLAVQ